MLWDRRMSVLLRAAALSVLVSGCVVEDADVSHVEQQAGVGCSSFYCGAGGNSPEIDHKGLHELDFLNGQPNTEGFTVALPLTHPNGHKYNLWVDAGRVHTQSTTGGPALSLNNGTLTPDDDLDELTIVVKHAAASGAYELRFVATGRAPYWARPDGYDHYMTTYELVWDDYLDMPTSRRPWKNICSNVAEADQLGTLGMDGHHVVVFENDRIDAGSKRFAAPEKGWVNIGCAGHSLAKLHQSGHTEAAQRQTANLALPAEQKFITKVEERQAWLKMIVGDYCGNGTPFTVAGQPLEWADHRKWMWYPSGAANVALEARWTADGATCLNKPRTLANPIPASIGAFAPYADVEEAMLDICGARPPECKDDDASDITTGEHMFSANPL